MNGMANALNRTSHIQISPESWQLFKSADCLHPYWHHTRRYGTYAGLVIRPCTMSGDTAFWLFTCTSYGCGACGTASWWCLATAIAASVTGL